MAEQQVRIHPVTGAGLIVLVAGVAAAVALWDWRWVIYGVCAFVALGVVGQLLEQRRPR